MTRIIQRRSATEILFSSILGKLLADAMFITEEHAATQVTSFVNLRKAIGSVNHPKLYESSRTCTARSAHRHFAFVKDERSKCELYKLPVYLP